VVVTAASVSDPAGARLLFARLGGSCKKLRLLWVDGTYRGHLMEWVAGLDHGIGHLASMSPQNNERLTSIQG